MLDQVAGDRAHLAFMLVQPLFGTDVALPQQFLSPGFIVGGPVRSKYWRHVVITVIARPALIGRRFEGLLRLEPGKALGNLLERLEVRSRRNHCMATLVLEVEMDAPHRHAERPGNNGMARLV